MFPRPSTTTVQSLQATLDALERLTEAPDASCRDAVSALCAAADSAAAKAPSPQKRRRRGPARRNHSVRRTCRNNSSSGRYGSNSNIKSSQSQRASLLERWRGALALGRADEAAAATAWEAAEMTDCAEPAGGSGVRATTTNSRRRSNSPLPPTRRQPTACEERMAVLFGISSVRRRRNQVLARGAADADTMLWQEGSPSAAGGRVCVGGQHAGVAVGSGGSHSPGGDFAFSGGGEWAAARVSAPASKAALTSKLRIGRPLSAASQPWVPPDPDDVLALTNREPWMSKAWAIGEERRWHERRARERREEEEAAGAAAVAAAAAEEEEEDEEQKDGRQREEDATAAVAPQSHRTQHMSGAASSAATKRSCGSPASTFASASCNKNSRTNRWGMTFRLRAPRATPHCAAHPCHAPEVRSSRRYSLSGDPHNPWTNVTNPSSLAASEGGNEGDSSHPSSLPMDEFSFFRSLALAEQGAHRADNASAMREAVTTPDGESATPYDRSAGGTPAALDRARRNSLRLVLERAEMEEKAFLRHEARWSALGE